MDKWENNNSEKTILNRRTGPDLLQKSMFILGIICWVLFIVALMLFHYARPEIEYGYLNYLNLDVRDYWHDDYKTWFTYVLWACSFLSLVTIFLNHVRSRRKNDHRWYNLILLLLVSVAASLSLLFKL